jgi:hypothetical protein
MFNIVTMLSTLDPGIYNQHKSTRAQRQLSTYRSPAECDSTDAVRISYGHSSE